MGTAPSTPKSVLPTDVLYNQSLKLPLAHTSFCFKPAPQLALYHSGNTCTPHRPTRSTTHVSSPPSLTLSCSSPSPSPIPRPQDEDVGRDDVIGLVSFTLAKARESGSDRIQAPVVSKKSKKQHGFVSIALKWTPNNAMKAAAPAPQHCAAAPMYMVAPPVGAPGAYYAAPPPMPMYPGAPAPVAYYAAPPPYGMPMQPSGHPPAGAPPPAQR